MRIAPPAVSVVIPSYNCEKYIAETISSVLAQTYGDLEVLVVDDGSTDNTRGIVSAFGSPVRLITQSNSGVCVARNRGAKEAKGEFICFMDHDDYWFSDKLALQIDAMSSHPECGVVFASFILWNQDATGSFPASNSFDLSQYPEGEDPEYSGWIYHQFLLDCWMLTSTAMFRREVFERCGTFDETLPYSEDWDLWLRISREYQFIKLKRPNTLYRQHHRQGNRVVRDVDYRTLLLLKAVNKWGFCSPDGQCMRKRQFHEQLSNYHAMFGLQHLSHGKRVIGIHSLTKAWFINPKRIKYSFYMLAGVFGWKPKL